MFKKDKFKVFGKEATIEGEWLNGKPHGICIFEDEDSRGVMIFENGNPFGKPGWVETKKDGKRYSYEYFDDKNPKGISRVYYNDKDKFHIAST